jgi:tartrate-resistant acid phosphatase type 5
MTMQHHDSARPHLIVRPARAALAPLIVLALALISLTAAAEPQHPRGRSAPAAATSQAIFLPYIRRPIRGPQDTPEGARFAVIGDYGVGDEREQSVATMVKNWEPDFVITTGDNNYPDGEASTIDPHIGQYYQDFIAPYAGSYGFGAETNRFYPSLGNHDWHAEGAEPYLEYFVLPGNERYYDVVRGPVHLFAVDSDEAEPDGIASDSIQARWLQSKLAKSTACWQLVYFHHPAYSSGKHGSTEVMQWPFQTWGADAVLNGHDHMYERIMVDDFPYFVNGLGGGSIYQFRTPVPGSTVRYNDTFGAMLVTATRSTITYQFIAVDGTLVDTYTQTGGCESSDAVAHWQPATIAKIVVP